MSEATGPLVSVLMLAYQNEAYVGQAIASVLAQQCNFAFELLIGEDASRDGTLKVIERAVRDAPIPVRVFNRPSNVGMISNYDLLLRAAQAPYVANIDGDDLWVDPRKLQKQIDIIHADPNVAMVFGRSEAVDHTGALVPSVEYLRERAGATVNEIFVKCDIPLSTVMFRRAWLPSLPTWCMTLPGYDWGIFLLLATKGKVLCVPDVVARYTWHGLGVSSGRTGRQHFEANAAHFVAMKREFAAFLGPEALTGARRVLEHSLSWAFREARTLSERLRMSRAYVRCCHALGVRPAYWWLLDELTQYTWRKMRERKGPAGDLGRRGG